MKDTIIIGFTLGGFMMENATNEMVMPTNYVDMTETDMAYAGSFSWNKFWKGVMIAGFAIAVVAGVGGIGALALGAATATVGGFATAAAVGGTIGLIGLMGYSDTAGPNQG